MRVEHDVPNAAESEQPVNGVPTGAIEPVMEHSEVGSVQRGLRRKPEGWFGRLQDEGIVSRADVRPVRLAYRLGPSIGTWTIRSVCGRSVTFAITVTVSASTV